VKGLRYAWYLVAYYVSWLLFGLFGSVLSVGCLVLLPWRRRLGTGAAVRRAIRGLFSMWMTWLRWCGCVRVTWHGFEHPLPAGVVYIANHPTLIDATALLARLPDAICIFKPSLGRNPVTGPAARVAGYVVNSTGVDLIRDAAERVAAGRSALIFPEGTRTAPGRRVGVLKPGFALIAARANAPVHLIVLRASRDLVPRGRAWWRPPSVLPGSLDITLDRRWEPDPERPTLHLTAAVDRRLSEVLAAS
jgi:1-acyl-sn-glycerol-3-phosphate acyltransferase